MKLKCDEPLSNVAFNFNVRRYTKDFRGTTPRFAEANLAANLKLVDAVVGPQQTMAQNVLRRISQPSILEWRCRPPDGLNPFYAGPYSFDAFANPRFVVALLFGGAGGGNGGTHLAGGAGLVGPDLGLTLVPFRLNVSTFLFSLF